MRLIDADTLIVEMKKWYWDNEKQKAAEHDCSPLDLFTNMAIKTVRNQQVIYDMDDVIMQLEAELGLANNEMGRCARENLLQFDSAKGYVNGIAVAIQIVKGGGVDNDKK